MKKITKIVLNGREYDSVEQMPPEVREQYLQALGALRDSDGDGVPDVLQQSGSSNGVVEETFVFNGRKYNSLDELPPEVREMIKHIPKPKPGENETRLEVETTEIFPPQVSVSAHWGSDDDGHQPRIEGMRLPWLLVSLLVAAVLIQLFPWLSGIKPGDLWRRF